MWARASTSHEPPPPPTQPVVPIIQAPSPTSGAATLSSRHPLTLRQHCCTVDSTRPPRRPALCSSAHAAGRVPPASYPVQSRPFSLRSVLMPCLNTFFSSTARTGRFRSLPAGPNASTIHPPRPPPHPVPPALHQPLAATAGPHSHPNTPTPTPPPPRPFRHIQQARPIFSSGQASSNLQSRPSFRGPCRLAPLHPVCLSHLLSASRGGRCQLAAAAMPAPCPAPEPCLPSIYSIFLSFGVWCNHTQSPLTVCLRPRERRGQFWRAWWHRLRARGGGALRRKRWAAVGCKPGRLGACMNLRCTKPRGAACQREQGLFCGVQDNVDWRDKTAPEREASLFLLSRVWFVSSLACRTAPIR